MDNELRLDNKHGEVSIAGNTVSVKITPDRKVWVRWESKSSRYSYTGRKVNPGLTRQAKELWLVQYRNLIMERFLEEGLSDKDVENLAEKETQGAEREEKEEVDYGHEAEESADDTQTKTLWR